MCFRNKADKVAFAVHAYFMCAGYKLVALGDAADLAGEIPMQEICCTVIVRIVHVCMLLHVILHTTSNSHVPCITCLLGQHSRHQGNCIPVLATTSAAWHAHMNASVTCSPPPHLPPSPS